MAFDPSQTNYLTFTTGILQNGVETFNSYNQPLPYNFGVLTTQTPETRVIKSPIHFVLSIDTSSSMHEYMGMLKKTIKNILSYLYEVETTVYITILLFNTDVTVLTKYSELNEDIMETLLTEVDGLCSSGMTNMELVFRELNDSYMESTQNIHLFLTDGEPTQGIQTTGGLCRILMNMNESPKEEEKSPHTEFEHHFMGFGTSHNQTVLNELVSITNGEYYFVDTMENAGLVYGEVLNNILYRSFEYITFTSDNIEFYNYKTNNWDSKYTIKSLSSMRKVETHIRFKWECEPEDLRINISYTHNNYTDDKISSVSRIETEQSIEKYDNTKVCDISERNIEIAKYMYRQEVLETLYMINNYNPSYDERESVYTSPLIMGEGRVSSPIIRRPSPRESHRDTLKTLFEKINKFVLENELQEDAFMKQLKDDVYVAFKSFGVERLRAYSISRHISQGQQRAYNVSSSIDSHCPGRRRRGGRHTSSMISQTAFSTFPHTPVRLSASPSANPLASPPASPPTTPPRIIRQTSSLEALFYTPQASLEPVEPVELSPFTRYTVSQDPMTPFATPQQRKTMSRIKNSTDI